MRLAVAKRAFLNFIWRFLTNRICFGHFWEVLNHIPPRTLQKIQWCLQIYFWKDSKHIMLSSRYRIGLLLSNVWIRSVFSTVVCFILVNCITLFGNYSQHCYNEGSFQIFIGRWKLLTCSFSLFYTHTRKFSVHCSMLCEDMRRGQDLPWTYSFI